MICSQDFFLNARFLYLLFASFQNMAANTSQRNEYPILRMNVHDKEQQILYYEVSSKQPKLVMVISLCCPSNNRILKSIKGHRLRVKIYKTGIKTLRMKSKSLQ